MRAKTSSAERWNGELYNWSRCVERIAAQNSGKPRGFQDESLL